MKNRSFPILMTLLIAFPIMSCSLQQGSLEGPIYEPQQKRPHQDVNVSLRKLEFITDVQFSPDGTLLAIATDIGIFLYRTKTYDNPEILKGHTGPIWNIAFRPDGKVLASGGMNGDRVDNAYLWDADTGKSLRTFSGHTLAVNDVAFSPDGKVLASACDDQTVHLWDVNTGQQIRTLTNNAHLEQQINVQMEKSKNT